MSVKRFGVLCLAGMLALSAAVLTGCDEKDKGNQTSSKVSIKNSSDAAPNKVELKDYEFPEFMKELEAAEQISGPVYQSFQSEEFTVTPEEQPFDNLEVESEIDGTFYLFRDTSGRCGLLDMNGNVALEADRYYSVELAKHGVLKLYTSADDDSDYDYMSYDSRGTLTEMDVPEFDRSRILFSDAYSDDPELAETVFRAIYLPDGSSVSTADSDILFDSVSWLDKPEYKTEKDLTNCCRAVRGESTYIISFDEFYNYSVYETSYALIKLKVGDVYGECYVNTYADYFELTNMIDSFGRASGTAAPSKDKTLDFIQITTGLGTNEQKQITISPDGFCLTDVLSSDGEKPVDKYFTYLDKEDFVDLVLWVDQVLSLEYEEDNSK